MSSYNGRRGPNVSQYIANLNTIPPAQEMATDPLLNIEDDLALFTNTEFFDFDAGHIPDVPAPVEYDRSVEQRARRLNASSGRDFQFPDFSSYPNSIGDHSLPNLPQAQVDNYALQSYGSPVSNSLSPVSPQFDPSPGDKRKLDAIADPNGVHIEEASRIAAEEDKRRRNTAASARFRVKKKQREQALEKSAKEMSEKVNSLETKVTQLEMENKWLKSLITEKNDSMANISEMYKKHQESGQENGGTRSTGGRTDGVGTAS
ncbi:hypothetical protein K432DRAFT_294820 [Lepidopterella palustris CBS 459.81]|uniref:BZIP domain-containing protein n=1 Tax=Lepidopterella palustris CBS 459.81 TaxID=1314670 RepID=A0A8E2JH31_9PEZI|nr:hypothetical protein K432DRAFT_294820 [Lepidopterella palustris CBS 459.81]